MKAKTISNDVIVDSSPDDYGTGWYVGLSVKGNITWLYPNEARKLAKILLTAAKIPRAKKAKL